MNREALWSGVQSLLSLGVMPELSTVLAASALILEGFSSTQAESSSWAACWRDHGIPNWVLMEGEDIHLQSSDLDLVKFSTKFASQFDRCIMGYGLVRFLLRYSPSIKFGKHYNDVIMSKMASQITSLAIVYSTVYSGIDQRKHQSSTSLAFVRGIHRWLVNSPHKGPVTRKMFLLMSSWNPELVEA